MNRSLFWVGVLVGVICAFMLCLSIAAFKVHPPVSNAYVAGRLKSLDDRIDAAIDRQRTITRIASTYSPCGDTR